IAVLARRAIGWRARQQPVGLKLGAWSPWRIVNATRNTLQRDRLSDRDRIGAGRQGEFHLLSVDLREGDAGYSGCCRLYCGVKFRREVVCAVVAVLDSNLLSDNGIV